MKTYRIIIPTLVLAVWAGCTKKAAPPPSSPPPPPAPTVSFGSAGSWSPDQKRLVVSRGSRRGLEIVDSATGQRSPLVPNGKDSVWSPDGRYIAFVQEPSRDQYLAETLPMWSKDGKRLAFDYRSGPIQEVWSASQDWVNARLKGEVPPLQRDEGGAAETGINSRPR